MVIELVVRAAAFAAEAHARQHRKISGTPYMNHLARVASEVAAAGLSAEAVAAAFLHDIVEDTTVSLDELRRQFPERVVELVRLLTQWWSDQAPDEVKRSEKSKYYAAILTDHEAMAIKLLDRADNLTDFARALPRDREDVEAYCERTSREFAPLLEACRNTYSREKYVSSLEDLRLALSRESGRLAG